MHNAVLLSRTTNGVGLHLVVCPPPRRLTDRRGADVGVGIDLRLSVKQHEHPGSGRLRLTVVRGERGRLSGRLGPKHDAGKHPETTGRHRWNGSSRQRHVIPAQIYREHWRLCGYVHLGEAPRWDRCPKIR